MSSYHCTWSAPMPKVGDVIALAKPSGTDSVHDSHRNTHKFISLSEKKKKNKKTLDSCSSDLKAATSISALTTSDFDLPAD